MNNIEHFQELGYCIVKSAIPENLRDFITQYALFDEMQNFLPESGWLDNSQVPNAHSKYADPAMESLLLILKDSLENNTGLTLYPTYSYYRVYRPGDELLIHKDRPSCEISTTLCFNYSYDDSKYSWPIFMDGHKAELKPGDMVIYKGCELDHWREEFSPGKDHWQVQGFFHYVDADGPNANYKFDGRESIGESLKQIKNEVVNKRYIQYVN